MKKWICLALTVLLLGTLALPVCAEEVGETQHSHTWDGGMVTIRATCVAAGVKPSPALAAVPQKRKKSPPPGSIASPAGPPPEMDTPGNAGTAPTQSPAATPGTTAVSVRLPPAPPRAPL